MTAGWRGRDRAPVGPGPRPWALRSPDRLATPEATSGLSGEQGDRGPGAGLGGSRSGPICPLRRLIYLPTKAGGKDSATLSLLENRPPSPSKEQGDVWEPETPASLGRLRGDVGHLLRETLTDM